MSSRSSIQNILKLSIPIFFAYLVIPIVAIVDTGLMGNLDKAAQYYDKALKISPKHKGALEYQGEMFLTQGNLKKAEANLKKLKKICFLGCKEEKMLKESIMKYNKGQKSSY